MGFFNIIRCQGTCPFCGHEQDWRIQYKYGHACQLEYNIGDKIEWGYSVYGENTGGYVLTDGCVDCHCVCNECGNGDIGATILLQENVILGVRLTAHELNLREGFETLDENEFNRLIKGGKIKSTEPYCYCLDPFEIGAYSFSQKIKNHWKGVRLHDDQQDVECDGWKQLLELIDKTARDGLNTFSPAAHIEENELMKVVTLPSSISKLVKVKVINLYGSNIARLPPEIGELKKLENFSTYTSYRLHWYPYEITECRKLKDSCVSTRALYGNFKYRPPFPDLRNSNYRTKKCSVCEQEIIADQPVHLYWISLRVAKDVLPLLVCACSKACIAKLPKPPENYVQRPHQGGRMIIQPKRDR